MGRYSGPAFARSEAMDVGSSHESQSTAIVSSADLLTTSVRAECAEFVARACREAAEEL